MKKKGHSLVKNGNALSLHAPKLFLFFNLDQTVGTRRHIDVAVDARIGILAFRDKSVDLRFTDHTDLL